MSLKVLELFAGIGACSKALTNLGISHEIADAVEIDKFAIKSFNAIHNTDFEPQDITEWDKDIAVDLIMHGSPCQDFSIAGRQAGGDRGTGTRSSLMYETLRIVEKLMPKYVIWENVPNILSARHRHNFEAYLSAMEHLGYSNHYQMLNAKDFGVPQNRKRVYTVSIFNPRIDNFTFPEVKPLTRKLADVLENEVDEKYFISENMMNYFMGINQKPSKFSRKQRFLANINRKNQDCANSITTAPGQRPTDNFIKVRTANKQGFDLATEGDSVNLAYPDSKTRRGRVGHSVAQTITTSDNMGVVEASLRIRKLTPKECWRLMGFADEDLEKAKAAGTSNSQLYKQAGNSIVVNVLMEILRKLLK